MSNPNFPTQAQNDAKYATPASVTSAIASQAATDAGQYSQKWKSNTAYASGQIVVAPDGSIVSANSNFISGASFSSSNWTVLTPTAASIAGQYSGVTVDGSLTSILAISSSSPTAADLGIGSASQSTAGIVAIAPSATVITGTDDTSAVSPLGLANALLLRKMYVGTATSKTLALTDAGTIQECYATAAATYTIPTNATVPFPIGTYIEFFTGDAGQLTIAVASGVTLRSRGGATKSAGQYAVFGIRKRNTDEWCLYGDLTT